MFDPFELKRLIQVQLPDAVIEVEDLTGGGDHFSVDVTSEKFEGKSLIEQHRMIYAALGNSLGPIHALQIKTRPSKPAEAKETRS